MSKELYAQVFGHSIARKCAIWLAHPHRHTIFISSGFSGESPGSGTLLHLPGGILPHKCTCANAP